LKNIQCQTLIKKRDLTETSAKVELLLQDKPEFYIVQMSAVSIVQTSVSYQFGIIIAQEKPRLNLDYKTLICLKAEQ